MKLFETGEYIIAKRNKTLYKNIIQVNKCITHLVAAIKTFSQGILHSCDWCRNTSRNIRSRGGVLLMGAPYTRMKSFLFFRGQL